MRAIFTVEIPKDSATEYLSNEKFLSLIRSEGWDDINLRSFDEEAKANYYKEAANPILDLLPEAIRNKEKNHVIFYGTLQDNQTDFLIIRENDGLAKFRLFHNKLDKLQDSSERVISTLLNNTDSKTPKLKIANNSIDICEKGSDHDIVVGRVIVAPFKEAKINNRKNFNTAIMTSVSFVLLLIAQIILNYIGIDHKNFWYETIGRLNTVTLTTAIVSANDFWQTYRNIKNLDLIAWTVASDVKKKSIKLYR